MANFGNFIFAADTDWESTSLVIHNYNDFFSPDAFIINTFAIVLCGKLYALVWAWNRLRLDSHILKDGLLY